MAGQTAPELGAAEPATSLGGGWIGRCPSWYRIRSGELYLRTAHHVVVAGVTMVRWHHGIDDRVPWTRVVEERRTPIAA